MKKIDLTGKIFGKLTVIKQDFEKLSNKKYWICKCSCDGKLKSIAHSHLQSGDTLSCGCLNSEKSKIRIIKVHENNIKYSPEVSVAKSVWRHNYKDMNFEDFYFLAKQNCFYCNCLPSNNMIISNFRNDNSNRYNEYNFNYNGIDRIDSSKIHCVDNCVTCCFICNRSKRERSVLEFYNYINNLYFTKKYRLSVFEFKLQNVILNKEIYKNINTCLNHYNNKYNDGDLTIESFYKLSQLNCYYCNSKPANKYKSFIYNGVDRIDNNIKHNLDNVITCCKYCNYTKQTLSLQEFDNWVDKIYNNLKNKCLL